MRVEWDRRGYAALRAVDSGFVVSARIRTLSFALLAALGFVLKLLLLKEGLFTSSKDKLLAAIGAFQLSI
jgi:hypothetical protein